MAQHNEPGVTTRTTGIECQGSSTELNQASQPRGISASPQIPAEHEIGIAETLFLQYSWTVVSHETE